MHDQAIVQVENLKKYYPIKGGIFRRTQAYVHAVEDVSFDIPKGTTLGLVGESGCGKTTTGLTILRLLNPTDGKIYFQGTDIGHLNGKELKDLRTEMQIVFQDPYASLNPRYTVKKTLIEPLMINNLVDNKQDAIEKAFEFLNTVGLKREHLWRYPHELSGGQRQRVCIARAILPEPKFMVLDEPTASLDVSVQGRILNLLNELQRELGLTYLFISHNMSVVDHMSQHICVMYLGKIMEKLPSRKIPEKVVHPYTKALMKSIPVPDPAKRKKIEPLRGTVGNAVNPPKGCRFHPRCNKKTEICSEKTPGLVKVDKDHYVACHKPLE